MLKTEPDQKMPTDANMVPQMNGFVLHYTINPYELTIPTNKHCLHAKIVHVKKI